MEMTKTFKNKNGEFIFSEIESYSKEYDLSEFKDLPLDYEMLGKGNEDAVMKYILESSEIRVDNVLYTAYIDYINPGKALWLGWKEAFNTLVTKLGLQSPVFIFKKSEPKGTIKPFTPKEALENKIINFDPLMIQAVNELIALKFNGKYSFSLKKRDIIERFQKLKIESHQEISESEIYKLKLLDFETLFEKQGWKVSYNSPSYGDSDFDPYFEFEPKKQNII